MVINACAVFTRCRRGTTAFSAPACPARHEALLLAPWAQSDGFGLPWNHRLKKTHRQRTVRSAQVSVLDDHLLRFILRRRACSVGPANLVKSVAMPACRLPRSAEAMPGRMDRTGSDAWAYRLRAADQQIHSIEDLLTPRSSASSVAPAASPSDRRPVVDDATPLAPVQAAAQLAAWTTGLLSFGDRAALAEQPTE
jgi:hypothetical protein